MDTLLTENLVPTKNAAQLSGYSSDYLARLARSGKIVGKKIGHSWFVDTESLARFSKEQGDRKVDYVRKLARTREAEYLTRHLSTNKIASVPILRRYVPKLNATTLLLRPTVFTFSITALILISAAFVARAGVIQRFAEETGVFASGIALGLGDISGNISSYTVSRVGAMSDEIRSQSASAIAHRSLSSTPVLPPFEEFNFSPTPQFSFFENAPAHSFATFTFIPTASVNARARGLENLNTSLSATYAFLTTPSLIVRSLTNTVIAFGTMIIDTAHFAIHADVAFAYNFGTVTTGAARSITMLLGNVGDLFAHTAARVPTLATALYLQTTSTPAVLAPRIASVVFDAEYAIAAQFVASTHAAAAQYIALISGTGGLVYEGAASALALVHSASPLLSQAYGALENAYLGMLGKSALALSRLRDDIGPAFDSFTADIASVSHAPALAAVLPALSVGEQAALFTYHTVGSLLNSATGAVTSLFGKSAHVAVVSSPSPTVLSFASSTTPANAPQPAPSLPTVVPPPPTPIPTPPPATVPVPTTPRTTITNYPTYTTVINGASEDFVNQSLAALRTNILSTVAGMVQPVVAQTAANITTIQQVNMIQDLSDLIVRNGDFRGGTFSNGTSVSATTGSFTNLTAGLLSLTGAGTTTLAGPIDAAGGFFVNGVPVTGSGGSGTVNSGTTGQLAYYAGNGTIVSGTSNLVLSGSNVGIGTTSPFAKLSVVGTTELDGVTTIKTSGTGSGGFILNANTSAAPSVPHSGAIHIVGADNNFAALYVDTFGSSGPSGGDSYRSLINLRSARGTLAAPLPGVANDEIGRIAGRGYNGTGFTGSLSALSFMLAEDTTATAQGSYAIVRTTAIGTVGGGTITVPPETVRFQPSGGMSVGDSTFNATDPGHGFLTLSGNLGVGTTSPYAKLSVAGEAVAANFTATSTTATSTFAGPIDGYLSRYLPADGLSGKTFLKINASDSGTYGPFQFAANTFLGVNPDGRPNHVVSWGWNIGPNGAPVVSGQPAARMAIESHYDLNVDVNKPVFEFHPASAYSTTSVEYRALDSVFFKNTNKFNTSFANEILSFSDTALGNQYLKITSNGLNASDGATWNIIGTSTMLIGNNNQPIFQQMNAAGNAFLKLPYINSNNTTILNPSGNELTTSGTATTTFTGQISGNPDLYLNQNNLGNVLIGNPASLFSLTVKGRGVGDGVGVVTTSASQPSFFLYNSTSNKAFQARLAGGSSNVVQLGGGWGSSSLDSIQLGTDIISSSANPYFDINTSRFALLQGNLGIGTTSPYSMLSVAGQVVGQNFVATSTTANSTFAGTMEIGTTAATLGQLTVLGAGANIPLILQPGNGSANIQQWKSSSGGTLSYVDSTGSLFIDSPGSGYSLFGPTPTDVAFSATVNRLAVSKVNTGIGSSRGISSNVEYQTTGVSSGNTNSAVQGSVYYEGNNNLTANGVSMGGLNGGNFLVNIGSLATASSPTIALATGVAATFSDISSGGATPSITNYAAFQSTGWSSTSDGYTTFGTTTGFWAKNMSATASGSIGTTIGLRVDPLTGGTSNYAIYTEENAGTNNYAIYTGGTAKSYFGGNVGIGTSSPYAKLSVVGETVSSYFTATSTTATTTLKGGLAVGSNGTGLVYDRSTGNVGIGLSNPGNPLELRTGAGYGFIHSNAVNQSFGTYIGSTGGQFGTLSNDDLWFFVNSGGFDPGSQGALKMVIKSPSGNVGIGTTSPWRTLSVNGSSDLGISALAGYFTATSTVATSTFAGFIDVNGTGSNATSTFASNLWVKGTLRAAISYVGDLVFANNFRFTEGDLGVPTQTLNLENQFGSTTITFVDNGNVGIGTNIPSAKLTVSGNVFATSYEASPAAATGFTFGTTTIAAEIPPAVLTAGGNVDLYKLATYNLSGVQALAAKVDAHDMRLTSLEARVVALESGAVSSASGSPVSFSTSSLASALNSFGVLIQKGIAQFNTIVFNRFVASTDASGTSSAGSETILAGNTVAQINNSLVQPSTKILITFNSQVIGNWWVSDKASGSFRVMLSAPQTSDASFDYFLVQTEDQITTPAPSGMPNVAQPSGSSTASSPTVDTVSMLEEASTTTNTAGGTTTAIASAPTSVDTTPPIVTLIGAAAMQITAGGSFTDPGATAIDDVDADITNKILVIGSVNTVSVGIYTLTYSATDAAGNTGSVSRVVTVAAAPSTPTVPETPIVDSSTTPAT